MSLKTCILLFTLTFNALFISNSYSLEAFADRAEYNTINHELELYDKVKILFDDATMRSNKLLVKLSDTGYEITSAVAQGDVFVSNKNEQISAPIAIYNAQNKELTMLGGVKINRDGVTISSASYTIDTMTKNSVLHNNPDQRVKIKIEQ